MMMILDLAPNIFHLAVVSIQVGNGKDMDVRYNPVEARRGEQTSVQLPEPDLLQRLLFVALDAAPVDLKPDFVIRMFTDLPIRLFQHIGHGRVFARQGRHFNEDFRLSLRSGIAAV